MGYKQIWKNDKLQRMMDVIKGVQHIIHNTIVFI